MTSHPLPTQPFPPASPSPSTSGRQPWKAKAVGLNLSVKRMFTGNQIWLITKILLIGQGLEEFANPYSMMDRGNRVPVGNVANRIQKSEG